MNIPTLKIGDYDYYLPPERIAQFPLDDRSSSKLIKAEIKTKAISHHIFKDIPELIPQDSLLVLNSSGVIAARLNMQKSSGGKVEILCVEPVEPVNEPSLAMNEKSGCIWKCIVGGKKVRENIILYPENLNNKFLFNAEIIERFDNMANVRFLWQEDSLSFADILDIYGTMPLPPYISRKSNDSDKYNYQTVYASHYGSVAAPTAGLHFDKKLLSLIKDKNIEIADIVLHVGPGTFQPVMSEFISNHIMHSEFINISIETLLKIKQKISNGSPIIAVGTTSLRALESLYWIGTKIIKHNVAFSNNILFLEQWEPYQYFKFDMNFTKIDTLDAIIDFMSRPKFQQEHIPYNKFKSTLLAYTKLFIVPGYDFKFINSLLTNFHLPKSTLLLLVAAFAGNDFWKLIYKEALENNYRFLSFGDASLLCL